MGDHTIFGLPIYSHVFIGRILTSDPKSSMIVFMLKYPIVALNLNYLFLHFLCTTFLTCFHALYLSCAYCALQPSLLLACILVLSPMRIDQAICIVFSVHSHPILTQARFKNNLTRSSSCSTSAFIHLCHCCVVTIWCGCHRNVLSHSTVLISFLTS